MQTVFITGAGRGIGLATARHFARKGWFVGLYDIDTDNLAKALSSGDFPHAQSGYCDVTDRASIESALADFAGTCDGQINVVVNNAGVLTAGPFTLITPEDHDRMIDVNVRGFTHVAQLAYPYLKQTPGACLVNLCSASSIHGIPNLAVYSASKFYVNAMTQALHIEWEKDDIRVTCVKPALVDTPMAHDVTAHSMSNQAITLLAPPDIAEAIDKAVAGRRISYFVGRVAAIWAAVDRLLPEFLRMALTRKMFHRNSG